MLWTKDFTFKTNDSTVEEMCDQITISWVSLATAILCNKDYNVTLYNIPSSHRKHATK